MDITVVSLSNIIRINIPTLSDYKFFASIFQTNAEGCISRVQVADDAFVSNLQLFDTIDKRYLQLKHNLLKIPYLSSFVVATGRIEGVYNECLIRVEVNHLNGVTDNTCEHILGKLHTLLEVYDIRIYSGAGKLQYFGESEDRTCRFCGKKEPDVRFSSKAHAISEFLGNKSLICNEECDNCNNAFSETIEQDTSNMLSFLLTLHSIQGKRGLRKTAGKNFKMSLDKSTASGDNIGTLRMQFDKDFPNDIPDFIKQRLPIDLSNQKYIPQNVYKCLCKYVISVLDNDVLQNFKETIKWINNPTKYSRLPIVAFGNSASFFSAPALLVSIRKNKDNNYPYCFAILSVMNIAFAFIIPFSTKDKYRFTAGSKCYEKFQNILGSYYSFIEWSDTKLSSSRKTHTLINFTINIPPECKLGRDYFIINKNK